MSVRIFAPAKINLTLQVGRARADGMHPLQSVVAFADVGDWVEAAPAETLSLDVVGPFAAALAGEADNLVLRAARALSPARGAMLRLEKHLPVASGIGGGSSDAAAALKALNQAWGLGLSDSELVVIAAGLGADVPVCLSARSAWMTGLGETIVPIELPPLPAVLVNPMAPLPTARVYQEFDREPRQPLAPSPPPQWRSVAQAHAGIAAGGNDLAPAARALIPEIAAIETALSHDERVISVGVSGSGATCFALAQSADAAHAIAARVRAAHPQWWVAATLLSPP